MVLWFCNRGRLEYLFDTIKVVGPLAGRTRRLVYLSGNCISR